MTYDHSNREYTSQSQLKVLDKSAAEFYGQFVADPPTIPFKDSKDMLLGRALHALVLQPERFDELCPIMPDYSRDPENKTANGKASSSKSTSYYQAKKEEFALLNRGKDIIDDFILARIKRMKQAILAHDDARLIFETADQTEVPHFWEHKIKRRCQMDIVSTTLGLVADIKKISGPPTTEAFVREARKQRWWVQCPWYLQGAADKYGEGIITRFVFILVNGDPPHQVGLHSFDNERPTWAMGNDNDVESDLAWAQRRTEELVDELIRRRERNDWTDSWGKGINCVPLPRFLRSKFYDTTEEETDGEGE